MSRVTWIALAFAVFGCEARYPEVVVVNMTRESFVLRRLSFNGCLWEEVLNYGDATSPDRCLPGTGHVHFQRLDLEREPLEDEDGSPRWFNYQTSHSLRAGYGEFHTVEIRADEIEQDFSAPSPVGH